MTKLRFLSILILLSLLLGWAKNDVFECRMTWYDESWVKHPMASGLWFEKDRLEFAHRDLPFGTVLEITNLKNGKTVRAVCTDRGPYANKHVRCLDGTVAVAEALDMLGAGVVPVKARILKMGICKSWGSCKKAGLEKYRGPKVELKKYKGKGK